MRSRGNSRHVEGVRVMQPWEDMKRNKRQSARRLRHLGKKLARMFRDD